MSRMNEAVPYSIIKVKNSDKAEKSSLEKARDVLKGIAEKRKVEKPLRRP